MHPKKDELSPVAELAPLRHRYDTVVRRVALVVGSIILAQGLLVSLAVAKRDLFAQNVYVAEDLDPELVWNNMPPSTVKGLHWVPCYDGKQCARLMVPLDYEYPNGPKAGVALLKVPSKFTVNDERYMGPILFNPGGPGMPGVDVGLATGASLQRLVGEEHDIIGFDPRGVGRTNPHVAIFEDQAEDAAWGIGIQDDPAPNTSVDAVARIWAKAQVFGSIENRSTSHTSPYVSTALVARDMLSIVQAHGRDKLQYWGFSYGTILGSTFAAMFPDHVGRVVIDGVVDADNYFAGLWSNNLLDADRTLRTILDACVSAGPSLCALHESTTDKVHTRLTAIFDSLKKRPLPVHNSETGSEYGLIDYKTARHALFSQLYSPYGATMEDPNYPSIELLRTLADVERGDGLPLARRLGIVPVHAPFSCGPSRSPSKPAVKPDAPTAIMCSDGDAAREDDTIEILEEHFKQLSAISEFADQWPMRVACSGWKVRPVERFAGPFTVNTSFPMLLIGNTADPVTPLAHAQKMSQGFNNSVVLQQESAGHCSIAATSLCTARAIREYFRDGKLPNNGTTCSVESTIFPSQAEPHSLQAEDRNVLEAWRAIRASLEVPGLGRVF